MVLKDFTSLVQRLFRLLKSASKAAQHIADFPKFILAMPWRMGDIPDLIRSFVLFAKTAQSLKSAAL